MSSDLDNEKALTAPPGEEKNFLDRGKSKPSKTPRSEFGVFRELEGGNAMKEASSVCWAEREPAS